MTRSTLFSAAVLLLTAALLAGCSAQSAETGEADGAAAASGLSAVTDAGYLTGDVWNDGQAEVAFYRVTRSRDQYGRANEQTFAVGTYLVKHRFSREEMSKVTDGSGTSAFKYALFYELESGSYQYKRNWVVNARQQDLQPLKQSFTSFDWCSNQYREMAFRSGEEADLLMRSDDYGNERRTVESPADAVPHALLPLLVRGLDFGDASERSFHVLRKDGTAVPATARMEGSESVDTPAGTVDTERIAVTYDAEVPSMIAETTTGPETYWRATGDERLLVKVSGDGYTMTLVEHLRTPYWNENLWPKLARIEERP
jgi:hypothetical protein